MKEENHLAACAVILWFIEIAHSHKPKKHKATKQYAKLRIISSGRKPFSNDQHSHFCQITTNSGNNRSAPIFPPILLRHYGLSKCFHPFDPPIKDSINFVPRVLYSSLIPTTTPSYPPTMIRSG